MGPIKEWWLRRQQAKRERNRLAQPPRTKTVSLPKPLRKAQPAVKHMTAERREAVYKAQNGTNHLTPRQRRRLRHKANHWTADNG